MPGGAFPYSCRDAAFSGMVGITACVAWFRISSRHTRGRDDRIPFPPRYVHCTIHKSPSSLVCERPPHLLHTERSPTRQRVLGQLSAFIIHPRSQQCRKTKFTLRVNQAVQANNAAGRRLQQLPVRAGTQAAAYPRASLISSSCPFPLLLRWSTRMPCTISHYSALSIPGPDCLRRSATHRRADRFGWADNPRPFYGRRSPGPPEGPCPTGAAQEGKEAGEETLARLRQPQEQQQPCTETFGRRRRGRRR